MPIFDVLLVTGSWCMGCHE